MKPEKIEQVLSQLKDPTTSSVLAHALGYSSSITISKACREGRIPGVKKRGQWFIPLSGVRRAIADGTIRPGNKGRKIPKDVSDNTSSEEEIKQALAQLTDPTTAPALARALGFHPNSVLVAIRQKRIPGAQKAGSIWLIPLDGVREAIESGKLRPDWRN